MCCVESKIESWTLVSRNSRKGEGLLQWKASVEGTCLEEGVLFTSKGCRVACKGGRKEEQFESPED